MSHIMFLLSLLAIRLTHAEEECRSNECPVQVNTLLQSSQQGIHKKGLVQSQAQGDAQCDDTCYTKKGVLNPSKQCGKKKCNGCCECDGGECIDKTDLDDDENGRETTDENQATYECATWCYSKKHQSKPWKEKKCGWYGCSICPECDAAPMWSHIGVAKKYCPNSNGAQGSDQMSLQACKDKCAGLLPSECAAIMYGSSCTGGTCGTRRGPQCKGANTCHCIICLDTEISDTSNPWDVYAIERQIEASTCMYEPRNGYPSSTDNKELRRVPFPWSTRTDKYASDYAVSSDQDCENRCAADPGSIGFSSQTGIHCWCYTNSNVNFDDPIWKGSFGQVVKENAWVDWASQPIVPTPNIQWKADAQVKSAGQATNCGAAQACIEKTYTGTFTYGPYANNGAMTVTINADCSAKWCRDFNTHPTASAQGMKCDPTYPTSVLSGGIFKAGGDEGMYYWLSGTFSGSSINGSLVYKNYAAITHSCCTTGTSKNAFTLQA